MARSTGAPAAAGLATGALTLRAADHADAPDTSEANLANDGAGDLAITLGGSHASWFAVVDGGSPTTFSAGAMLEVTVAVAAAAGHHDRARAMLDRALDGASELSAAEEAEARRVRNGGAVGVPPAACGSD